MAENTVENTEKTAFEREYRRILAIFDDVENRSLVEAIDSLIRAAAAAKVNLDCIQEQVDRAGIIEVHPRLPNRSRILEIAKELPKFSASYSDKIDRLLRWHERWTAKDDLEEETGLEEWD